MEPAAEYSARRERYRGGEQRLTKQFNTIGNWRLAVGAIAAILLWLVFVKSALSSWWLLAPVVLFTALALWHAKVIRKRTLAARAIAFYERGLSRLNDNWAGKGNTGERFSNPEHVYAADLDLFGKNSLFELLNTARTAAGEETLARWLLTPATGAEIRERQTAVAELRPKLDLREEIALLAQDVPANVRAQAIREWGEAPAVRFPAILRPIAVLLGAAGVAAVIAVFAQSIPLWPLLVILLCDAAIIWRFRGHTSRVLDAVESSGRDLQIFAALIGRIEREEFVAPLLRRLRQTLAVTGEPAAARVAQLGRLVDWLDSSDHVLVRLFRPIVLWREQLAISFEKWRAASGGQIGGWLEAVAEFEALSSLASVAYERPDWNTPEIGMTNGAACVRAQKLRHPLLPATECVPNDVALGADRRLLVVSGSNMSGKSTLLRALGLNAALAFAGGPVAAGRLEISPLQIGASIRIHDSLADHRSRFFAEISRIRQIVDLAARGKVLFLLDELLSGTNSHDRRIGAAAIVRELLRGQAIGLVTTHDLALAQIDEDLAGVVNVHFEDEMQNGEMRFDYKLKPGVVKRSNALELMRAVGLEV